MINQVLGVTLTGRGDCRYVIYGTSVSPLPFSFLTACLWKKYHIGKQILVKRKEIKVKN